MTGYRVYCFLGDSKRAEIIKYIDGANEEAVIISGLKPDTEYRVGIKSVSSESEGKLVFSEDQIRMRKSS